MIEKTLWEKLKTLVNYDKQIVSINDQIKETRQALISNQQLVSQLKTSLEDKKQKHLVQKKNVALQELTAQELKQKLEAKKEQISAISHHKEYKALEKEVDHLTHQNQNQEDILLRAWSLLEHSAKQVENESVQVQERIKSITQENAHKEIYIQEMLDKLKELLKHRESLLPTIPPDLLARYERMKHTLQDPIVPLIQGCCSACYYAIVHQDLYKLKQASVLPCRNCYRFLFYDEETSSTHQPTA